LAFKTHYYRTVNKTDSIKYVVVDRTERREEHRQTENEKTEMHRQKGKEKRTIPPGMSISGH
jgi:hypothetical protein